MSLHEQELAKYKRAWSQEGYRSWSPGENAVHNFLSNCAWHPGDSLVDLGCGTGRAGSLLAKHGLNVTLLDFCYEAIDIKHLPIVIANLWELPVWPTYDWLYSVDVLEHIPEEKVDDVLAGFAKIMRSGGYLQIALFNDSGNFGDKLHMTVKPLEWWIEAVRKHMDGYYLGNDRDVRGYKGYAKLIVRPKHG